MVIGVSDTHECGKALGRLGRQPNQRFCDGHERADRACDELGHAFGIRKGNALGHQLADHDGEIGDGKRNENGCNDVSTVGGNA